MLIFINPLSQFKTKCNNDFERVLYIMGTRYIYVYNRKNTRILDDRSENIIIITNNTE